MGRTEEQNSTPPLKRLKTDNSQSRLSPSCSSPTELAQNSMSDEAANGISQNGILPHGAIDSDRLGSRGQIRRSEFIRLITQALYSLGLEASGRAVEQESAIPLHPHSVSAFRSSVLLGQWEDCISALSDMPLDDSEFKGAVFLILQQKFLELLESGRASEALNILRDDVAPMGVKSERLHELAGFILCQSPAELQEAATWTGSRGDSRYNLLVELQSLLPPSIMIPERRLEKLLEDALDGQIQRCTFHNSHDLSFSLFSDHRCGKDQIPSRTTQVLEQHSDEVWYLQFSHDGTRLATASKDRSVVIWEVRQGVNARVQFTLEGHLEPLTFVAWSPDDSLLLTCSNDRALKLWATDTGICLSTFHKHLKAVTACAWLPDGQRFVSCGLDQCIHLWDREGTILHSWEGKDMPRITDIAVTPDGTHMVCICNEVELRVYKMESRTFHTIAESSSIMSLAMAANGESVLVNLSNGVIHLWEGLKGDQPPSEPSAEYSVGHTQLHFIIRSCFGGSEQAFIVSGSEDSQVYIWHRDTCEVLQILSGHTATVNAVCWNPVNPHMFASASDDKTVRLWGVPSPDGSTSVVPARFKNVGSGGQWTSATN